MHNSFTNAAISSSLSKKRTVWVSQTVRFLHGKYVGISKINEDKFVIIITLASEMTIFYLFLNHQTDPVLFIYQYHIQSEKISNLKNNRYNKKASARPIRYPQIGQASAYRRCVLCRENILIIKSRSNAAQLYLRQHGTQRVCRLVQKFRCGRSITLPDQVPAICK